MPIQELSLYKLPTSEGRWGTGAGTKVDLNVITCEWAAGKDSLQSHYPARPPTFTMTVWSITLPNLAKDDIVRLRYGDATLGFFILDAPDVERKLGGYYESTIKGQGRILQLFQPIRASATTLGDALNTRTVASAINKLLDVYNVPNTLRNVSGFTTIALPYWWKIPGESGAASARRLMYVAGVPSYFFEGPNGVINVLDVGWATSDTRATITIPAEQIYGGVLRANHDFNTINRAVVTQELWYNDSASTRLWAFEPGTVIQIPFAGIHEFPVRFTERAANATLTANYAATGGGSITPSLVNFTGVGATLRIQTTASSNTITIRGAPHNDNFSISGNKILSHGEVNHTKQNAVSINKRGPVDWQENAWGGITATQAETVAQSLVTAYAGGITTYNVTVAASNGFEESWFNTLEPGVGCTIHDEFGTTRSLRVQSWRRRWSTGLDFVELILELDAGVLAGIGLPFMLNHVDSQLDDVPGGPNRLTNPRLLWS